MYDDKKTNFVIIMKFSFLKHENETNMFILFPIVYLYYLCT